VGRSATALRALFGRHRIIYIDEAQRIPEIGLILKTIVDQLPEHQVIVTGSSALEIQSHTAEPLTGRQFDFLLLPLAFEEMVNHHGLLEERRWLEHRLVHGAYPEIVTHPEDAQLLIRQLAGSYLDKDILSLGLVRKPAVLEKLLRALALQLGSEVSYQELANLTGARLPTIETYIDLLEKAFVVFRLPALSRNARNEIRKGRKVYFYDNGIRNAIVGNFAPVAQRSDVGALWENYLVSERRKLLAHHALPARAYFWRTTQQQEIDYVEEADGTFAAYAFKWNPSSRARFSSTFLHNYPVTKTLLVSPANHELFLLPTPSAAPA